MIKAILFDLDNTLYNQNEYIKKSYKYICKKMKLKSEIYNFMYNEYLLNGEKNIFQKTIIKFNLESKMIDTMINLYQNAKIRLKLYKDVKKEFFKIKNYKKGIITNGGEKTQTNKIKILKLEDKVEKILITGQILERQFWKPHPESFKIMLDKLNVNAKESIYIGDKFEIDVIGAINAGILPVLINRKSNQKVEQKEYKNKIYYEINSFQVLRRILNEN